MTIASREIRPQGSPLTVELVAGTAGLGENDFSLRRISLFKHLRRELFLPVENFRQLRFRSSPQFSPQIGKPLIQFSVPEALNLPSLKRSDIACTYRSLFHRIQKCRNIARPGHQRIDRSLAIYGPSFERCQETFRNIRSIKICHAANDVNGQVSIINKGAQ